MLVGVTSLQLGQTAFLWEILWSHSRHMNILKFLKYQIILNLKKKKDKGDKPFEKLHKRYAIWNQSPAFFILQME